MTREEYIQFANALKNNYTIDFDKLGEFCDMAISLSIEPCEDCISREAIMDKVVYDGNWNADQYIVYKESIEELPSVRPVENWHPISEDDLPKEGEEVVVSLSENGVHGKKVEIDCFMRCDIKYWLSGKVQAWMPKPEPYKGG